MPLYGHRTDLGTTAGGTKVRKYTDNPFKPRPHMHANPKSRKHFPIAQDVQFCIRAGRCVNDGTAKCGDACLRYSGWEEKRSGR